MRVIKGRGGLQISNKKTAITNYIRTDYLSSQGYFCEKLLVFILIPC